MEVLTPQINLSDFAQKLQDALNMAGYRYIGRLDFSRIDPEEYKNLSPKEMAAKYAKKESLDVKKKILGILQAIYKAHQEGNYSIGLREKCLDAGLKLDYFGLALYNCGLVEKTGAGALTEYHWINEDKPLFSHAEMLWNLFMAMKKHTLSKDKEKYIEKNTDLGWKKLNEHLNPGNDPLEMYQIFKCYTLERQLISTKALKEKKKAQHTILEREISRSPMEMDEPVNDNHQQAKEEQKPQNAVPSDKAVRDAVMGQAKGIMASIDESIWVLNKNLQLCRQIIASQEKYMKKLRKKLRQKDGL